MKVTRYFVGLGERLHNWFDADTRRYLMVMLLASVAIIGLLVTCVARAATTVTLTANPTSGISPLSVTLTWSSTEATACSAAGGWTGSKAASGTQTITGLTANTTFSLTCTGPTEPAVLTWVAPTTNTDGSAIPATGPGALAKYKIFHASTSAGIATATPTEIAAPALTYSVTGLPVGMRYFAVKASNIAGLDSDFSGIGSKNVVAASATASTSVVVNTKPNPPLVTVQTVAYDLNMKGNGKVSLGRFVGYVELGIACGDYAFVEQSGGGKFYQVPTTAVDLHNKPKPKSSVLVARCEPSA